jgi:hypothetical protein
MYHLLLLLLLLVEQGTRKKKEEIKNCVYMGERKEFCHKVFNMWVSCVYYYHHSRSDSASLDGKAFV